MDMLHIRALTSHEEGRELSLEEAIVEIYRIREKIDAVKAFKDRERLEGQLRLVTDLV